MTKDEALRIALEYVEELDGCYVEGVRQINDVLIAAIKAALEAKDEPVAWSTDIEFDDDTEIILPEEKGRLGTAGMTIPLYTSPPKRGWTDLTDKEIGQLAATHLFQNVWPHSTFAAIHAIEAKLKEKNT